MAGALIMDGMCLIEIRAGQGGEDALDFANALASAVLAWTARKRVRGASRVSGDLRRGITLSLPGTGASEIGWLAGTHRRMHVPKVRAGRNSGLVQTSFAAVTITGDVAACSAGRVIPPGEITVHRFRSSGKGGQGVNTTDSAVRLTHVPTGIVVSCQDERSQTQNYAKALADLGRRLGEREADAAAAAIRTARGDQVGGEVVWSHKALKVNRVKHEPTGTSWSLDQWAAGLFGDPARREKKGA